MLPPQPSALRSHSWIRKLPLGTKFTGEIFETGMAKDIPSVAVEFTGRAWIAAFYHYIFDPRDPFPTGYTLSDTWPIAVTHMTIN